MSIERVNDQLFDPLHCDFYAALQKFIEFPALKQLNSQLGQIKEFLHGVQDKNRAKELKISSILDALSEILWLPGFTHEMLRIFRPWLPDLVARWLNHIKSAEPIEPTQFEHIANAFSFLILAIDNLKP